MDTNDNTKKGMVEKYTRTPYPSLVKPEPTEADETNEGKYRAFVEHREKKGNTPRFRIIDRKGQYYGCGYAYLLGWFFSPPETLSIYTTTHIFILTGKGLEKIEDALMREKIHQLREFNPATDEMPTDGETVILSMKVANRFEEQN